jgi:hypothetical protein
MTTSHAPAKPAAEAKTGTAAPAQQHVVVQPHKKDQAFLEKPFMGSKRMTNGDALADGAFIVGVTVIGTVATLGAVVLAQKIFGGTPDSAFSNEAFEL